MSCFTEAELLALSPETVMLEMGVGQRPVWQGSITVDVNPRSKASIVHDLNSLPYPFPDNHFDIVLAEHVIEHLTDVIKVIEEVHRILKPGGRFYIEVPHFSSCHQHTDLTHLHAFSVRSFDYFCPTGTDGGLYAFHYSHFDWKKHLARMNGPRDNFFQRFIDDHSNRHQYRFERDFTWIFPRETLNFILEPIK